MSNIIPNKLNIAKWIVALRSGVFKQAQSSLRVLWPTHIGYCCLGVACEISKIGVWSGGTYITQHDGSGSVLPADVTAWLGLGNSSPQVTPKAHAIEANDTLGMSFEQIADGLEKMYLGGKKAENIVRIARAEPKAWRILAEAHDAGKGSHFLCNTLSNPEAHCVPELTSVPQDVRVAMKSRITDALTESEAGVAYQDFDEMTDAEMREGRVLACLMFAEQAADEVGAA